jgi:hypothetical protein
MTVKCCNTCRYSLWLYRGATGRILPSRSGRCTWAPALPDAWAEAFLEDENDLIVGRPARPMPRPIWRGTSGRRCKVWEAAV